MEAAESAAHPDQYQADWRQVSQDTRWITSPVVLLAQRRKICYAERRAGIADAIPAPTAVSPESSSTAPRDRVGAR